MLYPLKDKTVTVFQQDTFDEWYKISDKCKYAKLKISGFVVENTELGESYADLIISNQSKDLISPLNYPEPVSVYSEDYDDYYCSVCTAFNWFASSHGLSIRPVPLNSSKITSSILEPVSISAVAIMVSEPPFSIF